MLTTGGYPCDIVHTCASLWPDRLHRAWSVRLLRATWRRGIDCTRAELGRLAERVVAALRVFVDRLARRLPWAVRSHGASKRLALRSLSQAVRGVSR